MTKKKQKKEKLNALQKKYYVEKPSGTLQHKDDIKIAERMMNVINDEEGPMMHRMVLHSEICAPIIGRQDKIPIGLGLSTANRLGCFLLEGFFYNPEDEGYTVFDDFVRRVAEEFKDNEAISEICRIFLEERGEEGWYKIRKLAWENCAIWEVPPGIALAS